MNGYKSNTGNTVYISPFFENGYKFSLLEMHEQLFGEVAYGSIDMTHDGNPKALKLITEQKTVDIDVGTNTNGTILKIRKAQITNRTYHKNLLSIAFVCEPEIEFVTSRSTHSYKGPDQVIGSLWHGPLDIRCKTNLKPDLIFNQRNKTNQFFLSEVCGSYLDKTIFGFALDGLFIKSIDMKRGDNLDHTHKSVPRDLYPDGVSFVLDTEGTDDMNKERTRFNYDDNLFKEVKNTELDSVYFSTYVQNDSYRFVSKDYNTARNNLMVNQKIANSYMYNQLHITTTTRLQTFRLGDIVDIRQYPDFNGNNYKDKVPYNYYMVSIADYHIRAEGSPNDIADDPIPFRAEYVLHCLQNRHGDQLPLSPSDDPLRN